MTGRERPRRSATSGNVGRGDRHWWGWRAFALTLLLDVVGVSAAPGGERDAHFGIGAARDIGPTPAALEYGVRVVGVGMTSEVTIEREGNVLSIASRLKGPRFARALARNEHTTRFQLCDCELRQLSYVNVGGILAWRFDDRVRFDWRNRTIDYRGRDENLRYEFAGETFVDKLSQYEAIGCRLRQGLHAFTLNYVDDVIARYRFEVAGEESVESEAGVFETVRLVAGPADRIESGSSYHGGVSYWLAPELGFYPVRIRTESRGPWGITVGLRKAVAGVLRQQCVDAPAPGGVPAP